MEIACKSLKGLGSVKKIFGKQNGDYNFVEIKLEGDSLNVLSCWGLEDEVASTIPTRTPSQKWTSAEVKWYANHWSYDGNAHDKVGSGEHVLEGPPKKPGGISRTILFLLGIFVAIDSTDGGQPAGEFDDEVLSEGGAGAIDDDLSSEGGTWVFLGKALLAVTLFIFLLFREKLRRLWWEWSIAMEVMAPLTVALEKFVVKYNINRENVSMIHSVLMAKLTREFTSLAEEDPERKVALLFSNIESEINTLCAEEGLKREDAVKSHLKKLWQLNKSHLRRERAEAERRKTRFDIWVASVVAVMFLLSEYFRNYLREHGFVFAAVSTALVLMTAKQNVQVKILQFVDWIKVRKQQREVVNHGVVNTVKDSFELELKGFLKHIKFDGNILRDELISVLWEKFDREIRVFVGKEIRAAGKSVIHLETCSRDMQLETIKWFFAQLWDEIQDLSVSEGRGWRSAVSLYFEKLCRRNSSADILFGPRRKYPGAEKWKKSVGLTERRVEPQSEAVEDRGITFSDGGTVLFGTARSAIPFGSARDGCSDDVVSAVNKRAGWVEQKTQSLYLRDAPSQLEDLAKDIASGGDAFPNLPTEVFECRRVVVGKEDSTVATETESLDTNPFAIAAESLRSEMTAKEPLDDGSFSVTICGCEAKWATVVNGVRYYGCARPKSSSSFEIADVNEDPPGTHGETIKERNRRLLLQDRTVRAGRDKVKNTKRSDRCSGQVQKLRTVEEVGRPDEGDISACDTLAENDSTIRDRLREVESMLRRKVKGPSSSRRDGHPHQRKIKVKGPSVRGTTPRVWRLVVREFSYVIQLYSCSAVRYAMFRSNRRFKPGD